MIIWKKNVEYQAENSVNSNINILTNWNWTRKKMKKKSKNKKKNNKGLIEQEIMKNKGLIYMKDQV